MAKSSAIITSMGDLDGYDSLEFTVEPGQAGQRLDQFLGTYGREHLEFSRSIFQGLIHRKLVFVDGTTRKAGYKLRSHNTIKVFLPPPTPSELIPEPVAFDLLHEDKEIIVLSKPPGIVVHPACGNLTGTLVHGLLYHCCDLSGINGEVRPGIVHRLDKDTSGVMVVAKNDAAHHFLVQQFKDKTLKKTYHAILDGVLEPQGRIATMIGRHPVSRKKMSVLSRGGREAITNWQVLGVKRGKFSFVEIGLETGRTHQIRVHMAHKGAPVAGDQVYGRKNDSYRQLGIVRQCLHASKLSFVHPGSRQLVTFEAPIWEDMSAALRELGI